MEKHKKSEHKNPEQPKRKHNSNPSDILIYPILSNVASGNEMTGMIPALPIAMDADDSFKMMSPLDLPEARPEADVEAEARPERQKYGD